MVSATRLGSNVQKDPGLDALVQRMLPTVQRIARQIKRQIPAFVALEDLIAAGMIGLLDAVKKYNPERENNFRTYATHRIRGSMLDELRALDHMSRSQRDQQRYFRLVRSALEIELGRPANVREVAERLNMSLDEYHEHVRVFSIEISAFSELLENQIGHERIEGSANPLEDQIHSEVMSFIARQIDDLPEKQSLVIKLSFFEGLTLCEIGALLQITESRVSQIRSSAISALRKKLRNEELVA